MFVQSKIGNMQEVSSLPLQQIRMEISYNGGTPLSLDGLFHGKSPKKMMITGGTLW
jgi:hypothetical protein